MHSSRMRTVRCSGRRGGRCLPSACWIHPPPQCMLGYTHPPAQCMLGYTSPCPVHAGIHTSPAQCMLRYPPPPPTPLKILPCLNFIADGKYTTVIFHLILSNRHTGKTKGKALVCITERDTKNKFLNLQFKNIKKLHFHCVLMFIVL